MKVSGSELGKAIREIVQEELKRMLPKMIREHLSERYIKKLMSERAEPRQERHLKLSETLEGNDDDEIMDNQVPEVPKNRHEGIYANKAPRQPHVNEHVKKLLSSDDPMSFVFEGVKPIAQGNEQQTTPDIPLDKFADAFDLDFEKMNRLAGMENTRTAQPTTPQQKMRELEERRRALEVRVR